jgi:hypothetical protein
MSKYLKIFLIIIISILVLKSCVSIDRDDAPQVELAGKTNENIVTPPKKHDLEYGTLYKNGRDWLVTRGEVGKYGGELKNPQ